MNTNAIPSASVRAVIHPSSAAAFGRCIYIICLSLIHIYRDSTLAVIDTINVRITERAKQHKETEVIFYDVSGLREAQKQLNAIVADNQIDITAPADLYALVGESSV